MKKSTKPMAVSLLLSPDEFDALQDIADEAGVTKAEYLRLLIQGIFLGKSVIEGKGNTINVGGYGYTFKPEEMELLFQEISEKLDKAVDIKPVIGNKAVRYKRIKTAKKIA